MELYINYGRKQLRRETNSYLFIFQLLPKFKLRTLIIFPVLRAQTCRWTNTHNNTGGQAGGINTECTRTHLEIADRCGPSAQAATAEPRRCGFKRL